MKITRTLAPFFLIFLCQCSEKNGFTESTNGVEFTANGVQVRIEFYSDSIVRVRKWVEKGTAEKKSLSVVMNPDSSVKAAIEKHGDIITLLSGRLKLVANSSTGIVKYSTIDLKQLLTEKGQSFEPVSFDGDSGFSVQQNYVFSDGEGIYGLGQNQDGGMNYRGKTIDLAQSNTDAVTPFFISSKAYGVLWDNTSYTVFKDDPRGASLRSEMGDNIDYYFIAGADMDEVIADYRDLTGRAPMYGKYAYGYWQSREHYDNRKELMAAAEGYRNRKIPIDNIVQDWDYWNGAPNWGSLHFDPELFPKPKEMIDRLHDMNMHLMISIWPAMGPNTKIYKEMDAKGMLYPPVGWAGFKYYDAYNPAANDVYWKYMKEGLYSKGVDAWWIDSTEPDVVNAMTKASSHYELIKMGSNHLGSFARYLNSYSLVMTDAVYNNLRQASDKRPYILTRSTFAGQQRNAATTWSGDIGASWEVYRKQIAAGVNHCMSGIPYWTFDIGAYVLGAYDGVFNKGGKDPAYQELYTRMFQFGAFAPIFRSHGSETPREIWEMGEFQNVLLKYDNLRYRLLPYIYSQAWKVTDKGYTIMRGLPMDFPQDKNTYTIDDQYMFGPAFLVNPVTENMYYKAPEASVKVEGVFKTKDGRDGILAKYYTDAARKHLAKEQLEKDIDIVWYTGRPEYAADSEYAVHWEGKLIPKETGKHQFHMKSYDAKRIILDGKELPIVYTSVEQYTAPVQLVAGKAYDFVVETENRSTGAARFQLYWKTPSIFEKEERGSLAEKTRRVYLPEGADWIDFWSGKSVHGGRTIKSAAPIDIMPLYVRAGSIVPMGPFLQYAAEKPADPIELRIYPGANGDFVLYEDENEFHNYEKGVYATITFHWDEVAGRLTIGERKGGFPGMLEQRRFNVVLVREGQGIGVDIADGKTVHYTGKAVEVTFTD